MNSPDDFKDKVNIPVKKDSPIQSTLYGSFCLDGTEVAVEIRYIQEAVNFPNQLNRIPLAPVFLKGIFQLREMIIPVVSLKMLLGFAESNESKNQKIGILNINDVCIGFIFDTTGSIIKPQAHETFNFGFSEKSDVKVIKGVIKLNGGKRLLQILDPEALISIKNLPQISKIRQDLIQDQVYKYNRQGKQNKCIIFKVGQLFLAFEITEIHEIINVPQIQRSPFSSKNCLGIISLRENLIIVLSFATILNEEHSILSSTEKDEEISKKKIIILNLNNEFIGLVVDSIESINIYAKERIMPIPILGNERSEMFRGVLSIPEIGNVLLLNQNHIVSEGELAEVTQGHSKVYNTNTQKNNSFNRKIKRKPYLTFKLKHLFGISITEVSEIINYPSDIIRAPGMPSFIEGIFNLRGKLITVVNGKKLYGLEGANSIVDADTKIVVFKVDMDFFGLIVDSVESILQVDLQNIKILPDFFLKSVDDKFKEDVKEIIEITDKQNKPSDLLIISIGNIIQRTKVKAA
jgi:purine-binding chemotaxis protein CheW